MQELADSTDLVSMGTRVIEHAPFPPDIDSIEKALTALDQAYYMNHRNGDAGHYYAIVVGNRQIDIVAENPYASDFDYGLIFGLARRFQPADANLIVVRDTNAPSRLNGDDSCTYHITW